VEIDRAEWARLAPETSTPLSETEVVQIRGLGDRLDMREVEEVYVPLSRLLSLYAKGTQDLGRATSRFLGDQALRTPFVIGVAGSVAVGKSTIARLLRELLSRWPDTPHVELVTTDGFLYPNEELQRRGIMDRKGFPESYDRRALLRFITAVKSGAAEVRAPFYSHLRYDIIPTAQVVVRRPDVLIVEGLNVLQPAATASGLDDQRPLRLQHLRRRQDARHRVLVRRPVHGAEARCVLQPELVLQRVRRALRRGGRRPGAGVLAVDQRAEPRRQHPPDPLPGEARPAEGLGPHRVLGAAPQALSALSVG
jgi:pantothenate kinase